MATSNFRTGFFSGWNDGVIEQEIGDSTRINRQSLARSYNIRLDETGAITARTGLTARTNGLPATDYSVEEFKNSSIHALIACDGKTIRVLDNAGWTSIGTFTTDGGRASMAMLNQRMYVANGADKIKVVDYISSAWDVRDAGVIAPTVAPTATFTGSGSTIDSWVFAYSYVDNRGFESNISPIVIKDSVYATGASFAVTVTAGGSNISAINLYASLRNQRQVYFYGAVTNTAGPHTVDGNNLSRDESIEGPSKNTPPPAGIYSLISHKNRLYGARVASYPSWYAFTRVGEAEYWPASFQQDLSVLKDPSDTVNFGVCSLGLLIGKETSALLLEGDPESTSAPQAVVQGAGLVHPDGIVSLNGVDFYVSQRGIMAHDGLRPAELWRKLKTSSDLAIQASRVTTAYSDTRAQFFFKDPSDTSYVRGIEFDVDKKRFLVDKYSIVAAPESVQDATRTFSATTDVTTYENVENGGQQIASGWTTTVITLSGANSAKLVKGTIIKFNSVATIYRVTDVTGANITLDSAAPADLSPTTVEYIRGNEVELGALSLSNSGTGIELLQSSTSSGVNKTEYPVSSPTTKSISFSSTSTDGNLVVAVAHSYITDGLTLPASVTPNDAGWTLASSSDTYTVGGSGTWISRVYYRTASSDPASYSWNIPVLARAFPGPDAISYIEMHEFSGASALEDVVVSSGTGAVATTDSITLATDGSRLLFSSFTNLPTSSSPSDSFTDQNTGFISPGLGYSTSWRTVDTADTYSMNVTLPSTGFWSNMLLAFTGNAVGYPINQHYYAETLAKSSFPSFSSWGTNPIDLTYTEPTNTTIRFGIRFVSASTIKVWSGSDWQAIGDPMTTGMTGSVVEALTAANMIASGGFSTTVPFIQLVAYMKTTDANNTPTLSQITYNYLTGSQAQMAWTLHLADGVNVAGGTALPAGTYIWDTTSGYRIEDGSTDAGTAIPKYIQTQQVTSGKNQKTWWRMITIECDTDVDCTLTVTPVVDDVDQTAYSLSITAGRNTYDVGIPNQAAGIVCQARVQWTEPSVKIYQIGFDGEASGESMP